MGNQMNAPAGGNRNLIIGVIVAVVLLCCCCLTLGLLYQFGDQLLVMFGLASLRPAGQLLL